MDNNYFNIIYNIDSVDLNKALVRQRNKMTKRLRQLRKDTITQDTLNRLQERLTEELKEFKPNTANQQDKNKQTNLNVEDIMRTKLMNIYGIKENDLSSKEDASSFSFSDLNKLVKIRKEIYDLLEKNLNKEVNTEDIAELETLFQTFSQIYSKKDENFSKNIPKEGSLQNKIENALQSASFNEIKGSTLRGEFGETLVAYVGATIQGKAIKELDECIVGSQTSQFQITEKQIPKKLGSVINEQYSKKQPYNIYNIKSSQDKVDVIIYESDNSKALRASVKTYKSRGKSIKPDLQEVSLFYNLLATNINFSKHWLTLHYAMNTPIKKDDLAKKDYDDELTKQILYEALVSGNLLKQASSNNLSKTANYIIILDSRTGKVIIKSTYNLLKEAFNNSNNGWSPFTIKPNIYSIKFDKIEKKSDIDIPLYLIKETQQRKILVSLKQDIS